MDFFILFSEPYPLAVHEIEGELLPLAASCMNGLSRDVGLLLFAPVSITDN